MNSASKPLSNNRGGARRRTQTGAAEGVARLTTSSVFRATDEPPARSALLTANWRGCEGRRGRSAASGCWHCGMLCPASRRGRRSAIEALPDQEPQPDAKRPSKQDAVIAMLRRPEGSTVDEVVNATGWQRHTVRGV